MNEEQLLETLVGIVDASDASVLNEAFLLQMGVPKEKHGATTELVGILCGLLESYDYLRSTEFENAVNGHSSAFVAMKRKAEAEPTKRAAHKRAFVSALATLLASDAAYPLVSSSDRRILDRIRSIAASLTSRLVV